MRQWLQLEAWEHSMIARFVLALVLGFTPIIASAQDELVKQGERRNAANIPYTAQERDCIDRCFPLQYQECRPYCTAAGSMLACIGACAALK
jgi:hypothetical protein